MRRAIRWFLVGVSAAFTLAVAGSVVAAPGDVSGPASIPAVECGDVVYTDVRLEHDLAQCPGYGLVVGADDITINLNGHVISSSGAAIGALGVFGASHSGVTVKNGSVRGFFVGVWVGERSRVSRLLISDGDDGVFASTGSVIEWNVLRNTSSVAVASGGTEVTVKGNVILGGGTAISVESRSNVLSNRIEGVVAGIGTQGGDAGENVIAFNTISRSRVGIAIAGHDNKVTGNTIAGSGEDGVYVSPKAARTLVRQNLVFVSGDDGIDTDETDTTLERNVTIGNGDLGIEADETAIDGGGNIAFGNSNPLQCTAVICSAAHGK